MIDNYQSLYGYKTNNDAIASPGAQTFTAPHDAYLTSVNLYFMAGEQQSGQDVDDGVRMEIRNVENGVPGDLYYSRTSVRNQDITIDPNGKKPTNFKFNDPVFLRKGQQYAIVLYTTSTNYQLAISIYSHYPQNQQANVTTQSLNPNEEVHGTYCYSMDGKAWSVGDPTSRLNSASGETLCLKFDVNTANFDTSDQNNLVEFSADDLSSVHYSNRNTNQTMNNVSYLTFLPNVFDPNNTTVKWYYTFGESNFDNAKPLINNSTIPISSEQGSIDEIHIWGRLNGTSSVSPTIDYGSMHLTAQTTNTDGDIPQDTTGGLILGENEDASNPFSGEDDTENAGEYIGRNIDFYRTGNNYNKEFNQIYASYEFKANGAPRPSIYFNLNANSESNNNFNPVWIQMPGYDEYEETQNGSNKYYIVDPFDPVGNVLNGLTGKLVSTDEIPNILQHSYSENVTNDPNHSNWKRYHFHVSLKRLAKLYVAYYMDKDTVAPMVYNPYQNNFEGNKEPNDEAHEIEFKLVFHTHSIFNHPKVRKFRATMNNSDLQDSSEVTPN